MVPCSATNIPSTQELDTPKNGKTNRKDLLAVIKQIKKHLHPGTSDRDPQVTLSTKLHWAQKDLWKVKMGIRPPMQATFRKTPHQAVAANQTKMSKALKYLIQAERNRQQYYAYFQSHTKPKSSSSLVFVTVQNQEGLQLPLLKHKDIKDTLLEYSCTHFATTNRSPFTTNPLQCLLQ